MDMRLTYTSDETMCVTKKRAYIGFTMPHGTIFTVQGLCDRVLFIGNWTSSRLILNKIIMTCDSVGNSHVVPDIDPGSGKLPHPCCVECLIQAAELLALCAKEKRGS